MPAYSYRCTVCDHAFDIHQAFSEDALSTCPNCGGALRKIFSPVGVSFSGSGFYRNDSRAAAKGSGSSSSGSSDAGGKDSGGGSSTSTSTPAPAAAPAASSGSGGGASTSST